MAETTDLMDMIQLAVRETIKNELTLKASEHHDGSIEVQLYLGEETIGEPYYLSVTHDSDHRHNFDHITDVGLEVT